MEGTTIKFLYRNSTLSGRVSKENKNGCLVNIDPQQGLDKPQIYISKDKIVESTSHQPKEGKTFSINTRFNFITDLTTLVKNGQVSGLVITGSGGLGKSHTVMENLQDIEYVLIKGYSSPRGLFDILRSNPNSVIVFDDCDSVLKDRNAVNLLKGAIDTGSRMVKWNTFRSDNDEPFEFKGSLIFISNMELKDIPQPILSRSLFVDVTMTKEEKIERIQTLLPKIKCNISMEERNEVLDLMSQLKNEIDDLNVRTFIKVAVIRGSGLNNWKDLATYTLTTKI